MSIVILENGSRALVIKSFSKSYQEKFDKIDKVNKNFIKIVKKGNIDEVINAINNGGNTFRCEDNYCLIFCATNGYFNLVKVLVEYGYLKIKLKQKLSDVFKIALQKASVNGHLDIVKYLFKIGGSECKEHIKYMSLKNYNYVKNFDISKTDDNYLKRIKKAQDSVNKISDYNKSHKRHKNSIMNENELLLDYHYDNDGLEYDENYKFEDEAENEDNDDIDEIKENESVNESDNEEIDIISEDESEVQSEDDEKDLFGDSDSESDNEIKLSELQKKKKILIKKNSSTLVSKVKAKKPTFISKAKLKLKAKTSYMTNYDKKSKTLEVILWYLSQDIMVNTDYNFISNYCYKHKLTDILWFLKKNNKLLLNLDEFSEMKI